jgi:hypothetical protein
MNLRNASFALMAFAAGSTMLLSATAAGAAVTRPHPHVITGTKTPPAPAPLHRPMFNLPAGYTVVTAVYTANPGVQSSGYVACPGTKQATGGGAYVDSSDVFVNINSSYPSSTGQDWIVDVNNGSSLPTNFTVYAVCMSHSASYQVVSSGPWTASSMFVTSEATDCPTGTVVTGGGAVSNSFATDVNINSTVPNALAHGHTAWRVAMGSYDQNDSSFTVYAVCRAKPTGYSIQNGTGAALEPDAETEVVATCPGASVPIGGGGFTDFSTNDTVLALNSSAPSGNEWTVYENNGETLTRSVYALAICAGT